PHHAFCDTPLATASCSALVNCWIISPDLAAVSHCIEASEHILHSAMAIVSSHDRSPRRFETSLGCARARSHVLLQYAALSQVQAQMPVTWSTQQPPHGLTDQIGDLCAKAWLLVGRKGGHMGFHRGHCVQIVVAEAHQPVLDSGLHGISIGK